MPVLKAELRVPGDKSVGHRALMLSAMGAGLSRVRGLGAGADLRSTRRVLEALGVGFVEDPVDGLRVQGVGLRGFGSGAHLDCGNSGTTLRLMCGVLAGQVGLEATLDGDASLRRRPMRRIARALAPLGAELRFPTGDHPPVRLWGRALRGGVVRTPVASAQLKSAALLAGLSAEGPVRVIEPGPSRDHTERMLAAAGASLSVGPEGITVRPAEALRAGDWRLPGDLSSAAFWLAAAALLPGSDLRVVDVGLNPTRTGFVDVLRAMGVRVSAEQTDTWGGEPVGRLRVQGGGLRGARIGGALSLRSLDELPLVALLAAHAKGDTEVTDAAELRVKECDRIAAMEEGLRILGADIVARPDGWQIAGGARLRGGLVRVWGDHRVALAFTVAGHVASGPVRLDDPGCAAVSYPDFPRALAERLRPL